MKICFVTTTSISIESFILPIIPCLQRVGFEVSLVTGCMPGFREQCDQSIIIYDYPVGRGFDFLGTFKSVIKFRKLCEKEKYDIVAYATPNGALYGSIGSWMAKVPNRVLLQWGMRYVGFEGIMRKVILSIEKLDCRLSTTIRNVSEKNRQMAINDRMYKPEKCKVLGKGGTIGVDLSQYVIEDIPLRRSSIREKYVIPDDAIVYGFVGRLCKDKGVKELLMAFDQVSNRGDNTYLLLVGGWDVNSGIENSIIEQAKRNSRIVFTGQVPNKDVVNYLSTCDVLVHPTYREGFGMVLQEAAALGLPTITTNIPGASEAIVDGETGLLVEKQDVDTLVVAMNKLLDPLLRETLGKAGRKRIEKDFERNMMIERICDDYLEICNNTKN